MIFPSRGYTLNDYQQDALKTAVYPDKGHNLLYPSLKLNGEAGEIAEKIGKHWRNTGEFPDPTKLTADEKLALVKEIGDVLWYCAALAEELQVDLGYVAKQNITKLRDRQQRGVIKSEGDNR